MTENYNYNDNQFNPPAPEEGKGMAIASLVLGILSILLLCLPYFSMPLGIAGLVLAILARKKGQGSMATTGLVLSIIGIALGILFLILAVIGFAILDGAGIDISDL